jgi:hypothetical protein
LEYIVSAIGTDHWAHFETVETEHCWLAVMTVDQIIAAVTLDTTPIVVFISIRAI